MKHKSTHQIEETLTLLTDLQQWADTAIQNIIQAQKTINTQNYQPASTMSSNSSPTETLALSNPPEKRALRKALNALNQIHANTIHLHDTLTPWK